MQTPSEKQNVVHTPKPRGRKRKSVKAKEEIAARIQSTLEDKFKTSKKLPGGLEVPWLYNEDHYMECQGLQCH